MTTTGTTTSTTTPHPASGAPLPASSGAADSGAGDMHPADLGAAELQQRYRAGQLSPVTVLEAVLERISRDAELNAYHRVFADQAMAAAQASDDRWTRGQPLGPLDGVPVTIKENMKRKGVTVPGGWAADDPPVAEYDAPVVARLDAAGALIIGSTVMPDQGMLSSGVSSLHGITRNAWNPEWTTGGSSSGAAVTAAAGHGPVHFGSDIGGSIRLPGTWSGLATLKPSHGMIPLDVPYYGRAAGPMGRRSADLYPAMAIACGFDTVDTTAQPYPEIEWTPQPVDPSGLRIGLQIDGGPGLPTEAPVRGAAEAVAQKFAAAGAEVVEIPPITTAELLAGIDAFWRARSWSTFRRLTRKEQTQVLPYISRWVSAAATIDSAATTDHFEAMLDLGTRARRMTAGLDLLISPVTPGMAFAAELPMPDDDPDTPMAHISYTLPFNMSGQPSGTVNAGRAADGRWIGVQITGQVGADRQVLDAMGWWEGVRPDHASPPWEQVRA